MFESKAEITEVVNRLLTLSNQYERGQRIDWSLIEEIVGRRYYPEGGPMPMPWYIIGRWRKLLRRDQEIVTMVDYKNGIRLLTHREAAEEVPAHRQRKAERQIGHALKEIATVDTTRLSDHERKVLAIQRHNMIAERRSLRQSRNKPGRSVTEVNPRRKPRPPRTWI